MKKFSEMRIWNGGSNAVRQILGLGFNRPGRVPPDGTRVKVTIEWEAEEGEEGTPEFRVEPKQIWRRPSGESILIMRAHGSNKFTGMFYPSCTLLISRRMGEVDMREYLTDRGYVFDRILDDPERPKGNQELSTMDGR